MRIGMRIRRLRLQYMLTLDELAATAQLSKTLLANIESGQMIPTLEIVDRLEEAMGIGVEGLFYDGLNSAATPWLTPRLSLQQLIDEPHRTTYAEISALLNGRVLFSAIQKLRKWVPPVIQRRKERPSHPFVPPPNIEIKDDHKKGGNDLHTKH